MKWIRSAAALAVIAALTANAGQVVLKTTMDRYPAVYKVGETAHVTVQIFEEGRPVGGKTAMCSWNYGSSNMVEIAREGTTLELKLDRPGQVLLRGDLYDGTNRLRGVTAKNPKEHSLYIWAGALFEPRKIKMERARPADFDAYWDGEIARMKREAPLSSAKVEVKEVKSGKKGFRVFDVTIPGPAPRPACGYLVVPEGAKPKSLPALVLFQGAGSSRARKEYHDGAMFFCINPHGVGNEAPHAEWKAYFAGDGKGYQYRGWEDREKCFFHGQALRAVRGLEWLKTRPEWNGRDLAVKGGSMGGSQSLQAAALDPDVTLCLPSDPALCDHAGFISSTRNRSGWPWILYSPRDLPALQGASEAVDGNLLANSDYFDNVFFAPRIKCPVFLATGLADDVCFAEGVFKMYNALGGPKDVETDAHAIHCGSSNPRADAALAAMCGRGGGEAEWRSLFDPGLSNALFDPAVWRRDADGCLTAEKDVAIWTRDEYARFELSCEYCLEPAANSGILLYCSDTENWVPNAVEIQLIDNDAPKWKGLDPKQANLSFFGHQAPKSNPAKPAGEWNSIVVRADGQRLSVSLNGEVVNECDLSAWTDAAKLPDGSAIPPWLSRPWADLVNSGRIGLQGRHAGAGVRFRNVRIRPLPSSRQVRRIMSYNVRMGCGHDDPFSLPKGSLGYLPKVADVINRFAPDVCGIQEIDKKSARAGGMDQTAELAKLCGMEGSWVEKRPGYGVAMLFRERPFRVSRVLMPGSLHTRALMIAEYPGFVVANTHFPLSESTCENAARIACAVLAREARGRPVFLMGDLNSVPGSPAMRVLGGSFVSLSDTSAHTWPAKKPDRTIDYVMVDSAHASRFSDAESRVVAEPGATDHAAVVVDLPAVR